MPNRTCITCGKVKDRDTEFRLKNTSKKGKRYYAYECKVCHNDKCRLTPKYPDIDKDLYDEYSKIMDLQASKDRKRHQD